VREELRARIVADKAADLIYERAGKIEDMLAGGTALDDLPTDLGLAAVTGTLDARGLTLEGQRAPIPGSDALVNALVQAAFGLKKGDPPRLVEAPKGDEGGSGGYFAVVVEEVTQPAPRPYAQVAASVQADWTRDAVHHEQDEAAAGILSAVKAGKTLAEAAGGREIRRLPPVGRASGAEGVPSQLIDPLFALKPGEPTMVETPEGFVVAVLADIQTAEPNTDPIGFGRTRDGLAKALADDTQSVLTLALRNRGNPKVNAGMIDSIATPE
jgi:peptidyl-prolyl cis-trans isomerase D